MRHSFLDSNSPFQINSNNLVRQKIVAVASPTKEAASEEGSEPDLLQLDHLRCLRVRPLDRETFFTNNLLFTPCHATATAEAKLQFPTSGINVLSRKSESLWSSGY